MTKKEMEDAGYFKGSSGPFAVAPRELTQAELLAKVEEQQKKLDAEREAKGKSRRNTEKAKVIIHEDD